MLGALATAWWLGRDRQHELPLTTRERRALSVAALAGAILGAKLPFWLLAADRLSLGVALFETHKTILGGLVGGYFGVEAAKWSLGLRLKTGDSFVVPVAAAIAVGRLGCLVGGCCFGVPTALPWGMDFGDGVHRHPTQVYEFVFHLTAAVALAALKQRGLFPRQLMKLYLLAYLGFRFATEILRPEPRLVLGLTGYQLAAAALFPLFVALWLADRRPRPA
ncbi:MAG: prolipoprotein diacylglyceryl transferase [Candidatus Riflebacteria bacterium]|nr:prolipoprotein diacylglyceryl transferase [Candidatus Riflebacteria bacterium]